MSVSSPVQRAGERLAAELGVEIIKPEGHDLVVACVQQHCDSSDGGRLHADTGIYHCYVCNASRSPYQLAVDVLGTPKDAMQALIAAGLAEDRNGHDRPQPPPDLIGRICRAKRMPREALLKFGARIDQRGRMPVVRLPVYGDDGQPCGTFDLTEDGKGLLAKGGSSGIFLPGRPPQPGEPWHLVEGVKDASALVGLGYLAAGTSGNRLPAKFAGLFRGTDITIVPDRDKAGDVGAEHTAGVLKGVARTVKVATLPIPWKETGGADVRDVLALKDGEQLLHKAIAEARPWGSNEKQFTIQRITSQEFDAATYEIAYHIRHLLVVGQPCIFAGGKKDLKTTLLVAMAVSLATGRPFLGTLEVIQAAKVGFISGESGLPTLQETARRICTSMGVRLSDLSIVWSTTLPQFGNIVHADALRRFLADDEIEVLILDPAYLCIPSGDNGNLFAQGELLRSVTEVCQESGVTLILAHHTKKGIADPYAPPELENIAWAGFQEFARQWLLVGRREKYEPGSGEHRLWLNAGGSAGHSGLWGIDVSEGVYDGETPRRWEVELLTAEQAREQARQEKEIGKEAARQAKQAEAIADARDSILAAFRSFGHGQVVSEWAITQASGKRGKAFTEALGQLAREGLLEIHEGHKAANGKTFNGYSRKWGD